MVPQVEIANLVNITPITIWLMGAISIVLMGFKKQLITGGAPHCSDGHFPLFRSLTCIPVAGPNSEVPEKL